MPKWKRDILCCLVWLLILQGICSTWDFAEVAMYGESQQSVVDTIMAIFTTNWINSKIWEENK